MDHSSKIGFSFGTASGIITTLGVIVGLTASEASRPIILAGILTVAISDAFSDALGIHISEESEGVHTRREIWISTITTYLSKLIIALTFLLPQITLTSTLALIVSIIWGMLLLAGLSYVISPKAERASAILEHLLVGFVVIVAGFIIGQIIRS